MLEKSPSIEDRVVQSKDEEIMEVDEIVLPPNEKEEESKLGCDMGKELSPSPEKKNKTLENITLPNQE